MQKFLSRFADKIIGVLSGFDRLVFRGYLLRLSYVAGLEGFLGYRKILRQQFGTFAEEATERTKEASLASARKLGRPILHLTSSATRKESVVQDLLQKHPVDRGLICVLSAIEPCTIWHAHRSRERKRVELTRRPGKCLHLYHYFRDPELGLFHVRLQTWLPFTLQVCVNGREWLARRLQRARMTFTQADNCFLRLGDPVRAQDLFREYLALPWRRRLDRLAAQVHPALDSFLAGFRVPYFWTVHQSEWATDVMFRDPAALATLYPAWVRHSIDDLHSADVFRFLGKKLTGNYQGEVLTQFRRRTEGTCVKHVAGVNQLKLYDKQGSLLRVETTINQPKAFSVTRRAQGGTADSRSSRPLRKGVVDLRLRANLSQAVNKRALDDLAVLADPTPLKDLLQTVAQPVQLGGRRVRALQPCSAPDVDLITAIARGDFLLQGFRNRDLVPLLFPAPASDPRTRRRRGAAISRRLRLLRAHRLIERVPGSYRYLLTPHGRTLTAAVLAARELPLSALRRAG